MRWPWSKRPPSPDLTEPRRAIAESDQALIDTQGRREHVQEIADRAHRVAGEMRSERERNHLGEVVASALRGKHS